MRPWKTRLAGVLSIVFGLWRLYEGDVDAGGEAVVNGLAIIGIGHKLEKLTL